MIHIVRYLHGGDPGREGRQLWSSAWPPYTALGLFPWPACLSVWSSGFHPPLALVASLFITFLSSTSTPPPLRSSTLCSSPTFLSSHPSPPFPSLPPLTLPPATHYHHPPPPPPPHRLPSQALHWIFHHKPPAACQSQRTLPPEAPTEGPASDIKGGIKANKRARIKMGRETISLPVWD